MTVPPLEAALIELFSSSSSSSLAPDEETRSEKEFWTLDELREGVGGVDKGSVLKALLTWIDLEVMEEIEGDGGTSLFRVIEASNRDIGQKEGKTRQGGLEKRFFSFEVSDSHDSCGCSSSHTRIHYPSCCRHATTATAG